MKVFDLNNNFKDATDSYILGNSCYWILINSKEVDNLKVKFNLKDEDVRECKNYSQSSQINFYEDHIFITLNVLDYEHGVSTNEFNIFLSKDCIITVYKDELDIVTDLLMDIKECKNCFILLENPSSFIVLYYIIDRMIVKNYDVISNLETKADKIEIDILKDPRQEHVDEIIYLRRQVYRIRKYVTPLRYIGDSLIGNDNSLIDNKHMKYFITLNNKIDKLMIALDTLVQDLSLVREAFESEIANKSNELMKVFTLVTGVFMPLGIITSFYGMNFNNIPPMNIENGYVYVTAVMIIATVILIVVFKRKKWL